MRQDSGYLTDFYEWTQTQAAKLREAGSRRSNEDVDWENVAEEIESLGRSDFRGLKSHVSRIIEHLLKLEFSYAADPRRAWIASVDAHRRDAEDILRDSPSLRARLATALDECYGEARKWTARSFRHEGEDSGRIPQQMPYRLAEILDEDWYPKNRHGLE